jgi:hypothetical protein
MAGEKPWLTIYLRNDLTLRHFEWSCTRWDGVRLWFEPSPWAAARQHPSAFLALRTVDDGLMKKDLAIKVIYDVEEGPP